LLLVSAMNKISLFVYFYLNNFFLKNIILNLSTLIPNPSFATVTSTDHSSQSNSTFNNPMSVQELQHNDTESLYYQVVRDALTTDNLE